MFYQPTFKETLHIARFFLQGLIAGYLITANIQNDNPLTACFFGSLVLVFSVISYRNYYREYWISDDSLNPQITFLGYLAPLLASAMAGYYLSDARYGNLFALFFVFIHLAIVFWYCNTYDEDDDIETENPPHRNTPDGETLSNDSTVQYPKTFEFNPDYLNPEPIPVHKEGDFVMVRNNVSGNMEDYALQSVGQIQKIWIADPKMDYYELDNVAYQGEFGQTRYCQFQGIDLFPIAPELCKELSFQRFPGKEFAEWAPGCNVDDVLIPKLSLDTCLSSRQHTMLDSQRLPATYFLFGITITLYLADRKAIRELKTRLPRHIDSALLFELLKSGLYGNCVPDHIRIQARKKLIDLVRGTSSVTDTDD